MTVSIECVDHCQKRIRFVEASVDSLSKFCRQKPCSKSLWICPSASTLTAPAKLVPPFLGLVYAFVAIGAEFAFRDSDADCFQ